MGNIRQIQTLSHSCGRIIANAAAISNQSSLIRK